MTAHRILLIAMFLATAGAVGLTTGCERAADAATKAPAKEAEHGHAHDEEGHDDHSIPSASAVAQKSDSHAGHDHADHADAPVKDDHAGHAHGDDATEHGEESHADEVKLTPDAVERYGIETGVAEQKAPTAELTAPARIGFNTERMAHVGSLVAGRVVEIPVRLGDQVSKGDVLVVLESPELGRMQSDYLSRKTAVTLAKPMVDFARSAHERAVQLYKEGAGISLAETQRREGELAQARREYLTAEAELAAAKNGLLLVGMSEKQINQLAESGQISSRATIVAPISGEVIEREVTLGELVSPDKERLMVLADLSIVWALVDVAEAKLGQVGIGTEVTLEVPVLPERRISGKVTYIAPQINEGSRTARLRVEVDNENGLLRPGMFGRATLAVGGAQRMLIVPAKAVMQIEGEPSVFVPVAGEANTFARRGVTIGQRVGSYVQIVSGLEAGERVVTNGVFILKADLGKAGAKHEH